MDEPKLPPHLGEVDAINNLDTARMALRWALERIHGVEREKAATAKTLEKAEADLHDAQRAFAHQTEEHNKREVYYAKMEELVSLHLAGKLSVASLVQQQAETAQLQQFLLEKQSLAERELQIRREKLEGEHKLRFEELEKEAHAKAQAEENSRMNLRLTLEKEHASKLLALREAEIRVRQQERTLAERTAHFEQFYNSQRAELERDIARFRSEVEDQVRFRVESAERLLQDKHDAAQDAWAKEKTLLLQDLARWRLASQEQTARVFDFEKRLATADEESQKLAVDLRREIEWRVKRESREQSLEAQYQARLTDLETRHREKESGLLSLSKELERRREEIASGQSARLLEIEARLVEAELKARSTAQALAQEAERRKAAEEAARLSQEQYQSQLAELEDRRRHEEAGAARRGLELDRLRQEAAEEQLPRILELERRLTDASERARAAELALAVELEQHKAVEEGNKGLAARLAESDLEARTQSQGQHERLLELERSLALAEEASRRASEMLAYESQLRESAEEAAKSAQEQYQTRLAEVEAQRRRQDAEAAQRGLELDRLRQEAAKDQLPRIQELERRLVEAERQARASAQALAQSEERRKAAEDAANSSQAQYQVRLDELEAQHRQREDEAVERGLALDRRREEALKDRLPKIQELERRLAEAEQKALSSAQAHAQEEERRKAAEEGRKELAARLSQSDLEARAQADLQHKRILEIERSLASTEESSKRAAEMLAYEAALREAAERRALELEKRISEEDDLSRRLAGREAAFEERFRARLAELDERAARLEEREQEAARREAALRRALAEETRDREAALKAGETALAKDSRALAALEQDLEARAAGQEETARRLAELEHKLQAKTAELDAREAALSAENAKMAEVMAELERLAQSQDEPPLPEP